MRSRIKSTKYLAAAIFLLSPLSAYALRTIPGVIEVGDTGSITIPFKNQEGGISPVNNMRLVVASAPVWVDTEPATSFMGPVSIYPGELINFNADYRINSQYSPSSTAGEIVLSLLSDSTSFVPSGITWSFSTENGFKTMRGDCIDNDGISCGSYLSPDSLAPNTYLQFDGPSFEGSANRIFLSTNTLVYFVGSDSYESNAEISRVALTGYSLAVVPASFDALNLSTVPVTLDAGPTSLYFASRDNVGNTEVVKSSVVYVDALAPAADFAVIGSSSAGANGVVVVGTSSALSFIGTDTGEGDAVSGFNRVMYSVDVAYSSNTAVFYVEPFTLPVGTHTVYYTAFDNVENQSEVKPLAVLVGNTNVACGGVITENTILAADLDCSGIPGVGVTIGADNVIFDGNGHKIIAPASSAIRIDGKHGVTVRNVDVSGAGIGTGVVLSGVSAVMVENVISNKRERGVSLESNSINSIIRNNNLSGNKTALYFNGASTISVSGNNLSGEKTGVEAYYSYNLVISSDNNFAGNNVGALLMYVADTTLENFVLNNNVGITGSENTNLNIRNMNMRGDGIGYGVNLDNAHGGVVENVLVSGHLVGIAYNGTSNGVVIRDNDLSGNVTGLSIEGSSLTIANNILSSSSTYYGAGLILNATQSSVDGVVSHNRERGIEVGYKGNNSVIKNSDLSGNRTALYFRNASTIAVSGNNLSGQNIAIEAYYSSNLLISPDNDLSGNNVGALLMYVADTAFENFALNNNVGITGSENTNLNIRNMDLRGEGGGYGLNLDNAHGGIVENVRVSGHLVGVAFNGTSNGVIIQGNDLSGNVTGLSVEGSSLTIANNILSSSSTYYGAGLILNATQSSVDRVVAHNRERGVEVGYKGNNSVIKNSDLSGNRTALYFRNASTITIAGNNLSGQNIGIEAYSSDNLAITSGNDFAGNNTGALLMHVRDTIFENLVLNNNVGLTGSGNSDLTIRNLNLSGPQGGRGGTGINFDSSTNMTMVNLLAANRSIGLNLTGTCLNNRLINNTIVNNDIGVALSRDCIGLEVDNSIFWANSDDVQDQSGTMRLLYSNLQELLWPGPGNQQIIPMFVDAAAGDFRLREGSSCIDAGTNVVAELPDTDLGGHPRVRDGDGDDVAVVDMGAYESQVVVGPAITEISPSSGLVSSTFTIYGRGFGAYSAATSKVFVGITEAAVSIWTSTSIQGNVPALLPPAVYPVTVERQLDGSLVRTSSASFAVVPVVSISGDGMASIITAGTELSVSAVSTGTLSSTAPVFAAMSGAGLESVTGAFYEFEPSGIQFAMPAKISFRFNPVVIDTAAVAIYYYDGVTWSSAAIANQRVTFSGDGLAALEGEISHTSLYALLRLKPASGLSVKLDIEPKALNLRKKGGDLTAKLRLGAGDHGCFDKETIMISAVNGQKLAKPIYAEPRHDNRHDDRKEYKERREHNAECNPLIVKFDREDVVKVLPANERVVVTVSGVLDDGRVFSAEDTIKTINPRKSFRLGKVYVSPNPAMGGKAPVFHVECGLADRVNIKVLNFAGKVVHERTLTEAPELIDDEAAPVAAYEYVWEGRIAGGVYYFTVEAEGAGETLKANGGFAVMR